MEVKRPLEMFSLDLTHTDIAVYYNLKLRCNQDNACRLFYEGVANSLKLNVDALKRSVKKLERQGCLLRWPLDRKKGVVLSHIIKLLY